MFFTHLTYTAYVSSPNISNVMIFELNISTKRELQQQKTRAISKGPDQLFRSAV